ncbi:MAG: hypothetical protein ABI947_10165 [Chloroflexota bacterium]
MATRSAQLVNMPPKLPLHITLETKDANKTMLDSMSNSLGCSTDLIPRRKRRV